MRYFKPQQYFWKILSSIGVVSVVFQLITFSTLAYFMVVPLGQRATDDLANVMTHAAEHWHNLASTERAEFAANIRKKQSLVLTTERPPLAKKTSLLPYIYLLESSLSAQLGQPVELKQSLGSDGEQWFWADVTQAGKTVRFGFPRSRIGVNPPIAFFLLISIGLLLSIFTAVKLTRRLTVPIERLHQAAQEMAKGRWPEPVQIDGPEELTVLAREFNRMNTQVKELLSNRTALLAGISHDLRTPLTQIQLALSMLPNEGGDPKLMQSIHLDLEHINQLIGETLSISLELEEGEQVLTDIGQELAQIIQHVENKHIQINFTQDKTCEQLLPPLALRRVISNLLSNALRYGDKQPVAINYHCSPAHTVIEIIDQGPGIPAEFAEAVFRPFFRLEKSRGSGTGGSGLGLAIVQQLAHANGWQIALHSEEGAGTKAVLTIPRRAG